MRTIKMLENYPPIHRIFDLYCQEEMAVFLDSSLKNHLGRYSVIGLFPYLTLVKGEQFTVNGKECGQEFEAYVKEYLESHRDENLTDLPIVSGAIGYFSYDYGRKKEGIESRYKKDVRIPECILCFYDVFLVEDHAAHKMYLVANGKGKESKIRIEEILGKIAGIPKGTAETAMEEISQKELKVETNFEKEEYLRAVDEVISHIIEGDIYIMNMTQQIRAYSDRTPYQVFQKLRRDNPSPFGGYFQYGDFQIVCASPERFLQMRQGHVVTRPIKGTRRRGRTKAEDEMLREELFRSEKDRSELLMIVDLERNDLNRVCVPGSVKVTELFEVETYATVFHLVATVEGDLEKGKNVMDLLEASFPGGSVTGAPKLRAMEIIDELEHGRRGVYTGSIGYLTLDGGCDFNIVIRTALCLDGVFHLGVGGGITCESEREFEYEETLQKAKAVLEAMKGA
ncbi:MAG: aminodeoxychorismate synthase component I [Lachnospiraceae bacterium]|nr:aminodeoxychorismate synthase component I [Lachnospiraceae bacterium]